MIAETVIHMKHGTKDVPCRKYLHYFFAKTFSNFVYYTTFQRYSHVKAIVVLPYARFVYMARQYSQNRDG